MRRGMKCDIAQLFRQTGSVYWHRRVAGGLLLLAGASSIIIWVTQMVQPLVAQEHPTEALRRRGQRHAHSVIHDLDGSCAHTGRLYWVRFAKQSQYWSI